MPLLLAAALALVWANSPWSAGYHDLWSGDLGHWIDDGLMTVFFLVIGLEIKQELVVGRLASLRRAAVPVAGAVGGMLVPAALYAALNAGGPGVAGWGIPMATDVAFAVGVLALLGGRVPAELKVLLLGLAIVDDIGAIVVIAAFYAEALAWPWLAVAAAGLGLVVAARRAGVRALPVYATLGVGVWYATYRSGVHATIAGVALGLLAAARSAATDRLRHRLEPWTTRAVLPLFALANAGVSVTGTAPSRVTAGVVAGLVVGKLVGVTGAVALVTRLGLGRLPDAVGTRHVLGLAGLAGIGFTVSIFVAGLAFEGEALTEQAKLGVLLASVLASAVGVAILALPSRRCAPATSS